MGFSKFPVFIPPVRRGKNAQKNRAHPPTIRQPPPRIKRKRFSKNPVGMLYNAIDDLEEKLLRKLRNRARLMKAKRKEACIGG